MRRWTLTLNKKLSVNLRWAFEVLKLPKLNVVFFIRRRQLFTLVVFYFQIAGFQNSNQSESVPHYRQLHSLLPIGWTCCTFRFRTSSVALSTFQGRQKKFANVIGWNSCITHLAITSRATLIANGKWQMDIRRPVVSTLAVFLKKGFKLSVWVTWEFRRPIN
jgi:hypothetical protein